MREADPQPAEPKPGRRRFQYSFRTLILIVTTTAVVLSLNAWNRDYYCAVAFDGYYYGWPFLCLDVPRAKCAVEIDFPRLAADLVVGLALIAGVAVTSETLRKRRLTLARRP